MHAFFQWLIDWSTWAVNKYWNFLFFCFQHLYLTIILSLLINVYYDEWTSKRGQLAKWVHDSKLQPSTSAWVQTPPALMHACAFNSCQWLIIGWCFFCVLWFSLTITLVVPILPEISMHWLCIFDDTFHWKMTEMFEL